MLKRFPPDFRLIVLLLRIELRTASPDAARVLIEREAIDWDAFEQLLQRHRVLMPVWRVMESTGLTDLAPEAARRRLAERNRTLTMRQMGLVRDLLEVGQAFDAVGIPFVTLKGPALSQLLHGDPLARHCVDLDVLVAAADHPAATAALQALGYRGEVEPYDRASKRLEEFAHLDHHRHFVRGPRVLELHWRLSNNAFLCPRATEEVIARRGEARLGGRVLPVLSDLDLRAYLTMHAASHCWSRLKWLYDLAALGAGPSPKSDGALDSGQLAGDSWREAMLDAIFPVASVIERWPSTSVRVLRSIALTQMGDAKEADGAANVLRRSIALLLCAPGASEKARLAIQLATWKPCVGRFPLPRAWWVLYLGLGPAYWCWRKTWGDKCRRASRRTRVLPAPEYVE